MFSEKHLIVTMLHEVTSFKTIYCKTYWMHGFNLAQAKPLQPLELFSYKGLRSLNATFTPHSSGCCFKFIKYELEFEHMYG